MATKEHYLRWEKAFAEANGVDLKTAVQGSVWPNGDGSLTYTRIVTDPHGTVLKYADGELVSEEVTLLIAKNIKLGDVE